MTRIMLLWLAALLGLRVWLPLAVEAQSHPLRHIVVVGTVASEGVLHGVLTITRLALNETGQLVATGTLAGTAGTQVIQDTLTALVDQFRQGNGPGVCAQLILDLAPAHLDGLGLTVEVSRLTLDLTAQRGPDALLGHLLCALTYLLENPSEHVSGIQILLNAINPRLSPGHQTTCLEGAGGSKRYVSAYTG
jgi:hypothetical protein